MLDAKLLLWIVFISYLPRFILSIRLGTLSTIQYHLSNFSRFIQQKDYVYAYSTQRFLSFIYLLLQFAITLHSGHQIILTPECSTRSPHSFIIRADFSAYFSDVICLLNLSFLFHGLVFYFKLMMNS